MSSHDPHRGLLASFVPRHITSQIDGLIESANHSNLEIFVFVFDADRVLDVEGYSSGVKVRRIEDNAAERSFWLGTTKAEERFLKEGFHPQNRFDDFGSATSKLDLDITDIASYVRPPGAESSGGNIDSESSRASFNYPFSRELEQNRLDCVSASLMTSSAHRAGADSFDRHGGVVPVSGRSPSLAEKGDGRWEVGDLCGNAPPSRSCQCVVGGTDSRRPEDVVTVTSSPDFPATVAELALSPGHIMRLYLAAVRRELGELTDYGGSIAEEIRGRRKVDEVSKEAAVAKRGRKRVCVAESCPPAVAKKCEGKKRAVASATPKAIKSTNGPSPPSLNVKARGIGVASVPSFIAPSSTPGQVASGNYRSKTAPEDCAGYPIGAVPPAANGAALSRPAAPAGKKSRKKSLTSASKSSPPARPAKPSRKRRKSVKSVEVFGGGDGTVASSSDTGISDGGEESATDGDKSIAPLRSYKKKPLTELQEATIRGLYERFRFVPDEDIETPFIYPSQGNHVGVCKPKAFCSGFRYHYQSLVVSTNDIKFQCMSLKNVRDRKLRCPAKILYNLDTGDSRQIADHVCSLTKDINLSKERAIKEIKFRLELAA